MTYTLFGVNQERFIQIASQVKCVVKGKEKIGIKIGLEHIAVFNWFCKFASTGKMSKVYKKDDNIPFYWTSYDAVIEDLPIIFNKYGEDSKYSAKQKKRFCAKIFNDLVNCGFVDVYIKKNQGTYTFYKLVPETYKLLVEKLNENKSKKKLTGESKRFCQAVKTVLSVSQNGSHEVRQNGIQKTPLLNPITNTPILKPRVNRPLKQEMEKLGTGERRNEKTEENNIFIKNHNNVCKEKKSQSGLPDYASQDPFFQLSEEEKKRASKLRVSVKSEIALVLFKEHYVYCSEEKKKEILNIIKKAIKNEDYGQLKKENFFYV